MTRSFSLAKTPTSFRVTTTEQEDKVLANFDLPTRAIPGPVSDVSYDENIGRQVAIIGRYVLVRRHKSNHFHDYVLVGSIHEHSRRNVPYGAWRCAPPIPSQAVVSSAQNC